jgi:hypothetical protein
MNREQLESLKPYCNTEMQLKRLEAYIEHGTQKKAAKALGCDKRRLQESISAIRKHARKQGFEVGGDPFQPIPGHFVKGESALVGSDGVTRMKWVKTDTAKELQLDELRKSIQATFESYKGLSPTIEQPEHTNDELLCILPIGDQHVGVLSWFDETGHNYDLDIAQREFNIAVERVIDSAPNAETCIIMDMGDFLHAQDNKNQTPYSGNTLDCDGRSMKRKRVALNMLIHAIHYACNKFKKVLVRNVLGNHSPEGEQMIALALELFFHNNDQVTVDSSSNKFWYHKFGKNLFGAHHGDKIKKNELPLIMATDAAKWWGETEYRYFLIGHIHHETVKEYQGCSVESFNTLASGDAWHHASGYRARQNMKMITYHKDYGEIERSTRDIAVIKDALLALEK